MLYRLEPDRENSVEILVFRGVKNAKDVRLRMMKGEFSAAFLKAHLILDVFQVLVAASTALYSKKANTMSTRNIFTEIVYNLSGTRSMSKALVGFGIAEDTTDLVVVLPNATPSNISDIRKAIEGIEIMSVVDGIKQTSDLAQIRKLYGITDDEDRCGSLLDSVVTRMACRDVR